ncbi:MAG TPA: LysR substrate-binding domain-containing protein [Bradyrhizobium sp.]
MRLSVKQVEYFLATVDAGQVSQAAIALNVSQSAVTTALQQLEVQLGVSLFNRRPSGMDLTLEGARFVQHARNVMAAVNEAVSSPLTEDTSHSGRVRVGVTYTVAGYFLPRHLARFLRTYPQITVDLIELPRETIERRIVDRTLDIAVMLVSNLQNRRDTTCETLVRSRRRLWLPIEHPLLHASSLTLEDIAKEPYIMLTVDEAGKTAARYWKPTGLRPRTIIRTSSVEAVRGMVAAGMGVTILSDMVYRPWSLDGQRIELRPVAADIPSMDIGLAWNTKREISSATKLFREFLSLNFSGAAH